jgi:hypothetical protein
VLSSSTLEPSVSAQKAANRNASGQSKATDFTKEATDRPTTVDADRGAVEPGQRTEPSTSALK